MELKWTHGGHLSPECKTIERDGQQFGIVEGYIASFKIEEMAYPDKFEKGAFLDSIADHKRRGNRPIRLNFQHERNPIGGFPIDSVFEDERGLFGVAEINLEKQLGREVYALAKQGVLRDFSIGFVPTEWNIEDDTRIISKAQVFEGSIVDEPMNPDAQVTSVKNADNGTFFRSVDVTEWTDRDLEAALTSTKQFSRSAVKALVGRLRDVDGGTLPADKVDTPEDLNVLSDLLAELKGFSDKLKG